MVQSLVLTYLGMELRWVGWTDAMELRHKCCHFRPFWTAPCPAFEYYVIQFCVLISHLKHIQFVPFFNTFLTCDLIFLTNYNEHYFSLTRTSTKVCDPAGCFKSLETGPDSGVSWVGPKAAFSFRLCRLRVSACFFLS